MVKYKNSVGDGILRRIIEQAHDEEGYSLTDLTVLSLQVDPYRLDTEANHRDGRWLAEQLQAGYGSSKRAHWRGLHYAIVTRGNVKKPDGSIYLNTDDDWNWLIGSPAKAARWLGYVSFDRIIDQRNAPAIIHRKARVEPQSWLSIGLDIEVPDVDDIEPVPRAMGFDARQAFHFAIFGEKSSLEDVLLPIAEEYEADLYLPTGEISDTLIYQMAKDGADDGRPMVVFTASDCDPSGWQMPVSIARKLQAFRDLSFGELEFEVVHVGLTPDQVRNIRPKLPETPLKKEEKRSKRWQKAFGVKQTEVDALTTPARSHILRQMFERAFAVYRDDGLYDRVEQAEADWIEQAQAEIDSHLDAKRLAAIRTEATAKLKQMRKDIDKLKKKLRIDAELPPIDVPQADVELDPSRQALVKFDDDWITASCALKAHKSYGRDDDNGD
jgi:hypothetical protein